MATLPGPPYNDAKPGCLYLVPVVATITTQPQYFAVHQSHHCRVKQLIAGGSYVKGKKKPGYKHTKKRRPHKRGPYNKSKPYKKRKPHAPGSRGPYKKQGPSKRKKQDKTKRKKHKKQDKTKRKKSKKYKPRYDPIEFGREMDVVISGFFEVGEQLPMRSKKKESPNC